MNSEYLNKLASLVVSKGVNVQKGQIVIVNAPIEASELARQVVKECYKKGAGRVIMRYNDEIIDHDTYLNADPKLLSNPGNWESAMQNETADQGACYIHIIGEDPDLMKDTNPEILQKRSLNLNKAMALYRKKQSQNEIAWSIIPAAVPSWAIKVYPNLSEQEAVEQLWSDLFKVCRIDEKDPEENWNIHNKNFEKRSKILNELNLKKLVYKNSLGTNLEVGLPEGYIFMGGGNYLKNGVFTFPNIPTEEIFSAPHRLKVNGRLHASMPLVYNGNLIDNFWFDFKDGKVVDFDAETGKETLQSILDSDEGSRYLGEVALVPVNSPISLLNKQFYNTLIDENASCHFALGRSYTDTIENGLEMSEEELLNRGMNQSDVHVDFMVGTPDLSITGITQENKEVPVFENGQFTALFD